MPDIELPSLSDPHNRHLRQFFLTVVTGSCLVTIPWIGYLAVALPDHHPATQWRVAWVGFDVALVVGLMVTAVGAWTRKQFTVPAAIFTATLLCCDAWFDIVLDWGTPDAAASLLSAAFAELPLAGLLFLAAFRIVRLTIRAALLITGHTGPVPPFHRLSLIVISEMTAPADESV